MDKKIGCRYGFKVACAASVLDMENVKNLFNFMTKDINYDGSY